MLKVVDEICQELRIEYFLAYGTLLGAIRHKGFIPWDDDIDIGMDRSNYERFISESPSRLAAYGYKLQHRSTDCYCVYNYVKIRKDDTSYVEWCNRNSAQLNGIYIDIFVFDDAPDDINEAKKWGKKIKSLDRKYTFHQTPDISEPPVGMKRRFIQFVRRCLYLVLQIESIDSLHAKFTKLQTKYRNAGTEHIADMTYGRYRWAYYAKEDVFPVKRGRFEDIEVYFPNKPEKMLSETYGDYMALPPEDKRYGHKPYILSF